MRDKHAPQRINRINRTNPLCYAVNAVNAVNTAHDGITVVDFLFAVTRDQLGAAMVHGSSLAFPITGTKRRGLALVMRFL